MAKTKIICKTCKGENVVFDAWASFNFEAQEFELETTFSETFCKDCECTCAIERVEVEEVQP